MILGDVGEVIDRGQHSYCTIVVHSLGDEVKRDLPIVLVPVEWPGDEPVDQCDKVSLEKPGLGSELIHRDRLVLDFDVVEVGEE